MNSPSKEKSPPSKPKDPGHSIAIFGIIVSILVGGLLNPEIRSFLGLDKPEEEVTESLAPPDSTVRPIEEPTEIPGASNSAAVPITGPCLDINNPEHVANLSRFILPDGSTCIQSGSEFYQLPASTVYPSTQEQQSGDFYTLPRSPVYDEFMREQQTGKF